MKKLPFSTSRIWFVLVFFLLAALPLAARENTTRDVPGKYLDIVQNGRVIARYMYEHDVTTKENRHRTYKPYLHVMGPDGKTPITKGPGGQFTHHRGIFLGWSRIGFRGKRLDLWHMKTSEIIHQEFVKRESNDKQTVVAVKLHWMDPEGAVILEEIRTMTFDHTDKDALLNATFSCQLKAVTDDVVLDGDPEHAGFQYRPSDEVSRNKSAKYLFHQDGINPRKDKDLPWVALNYETGGKDYTVIHMNHPDNPRGTIYSAYRDYGRFGAFPRLKIAKGKSATLKYGIRVSPGGFPSRESLDAIYQAYIR